MRVAGGDGGGNDVESLSRHIHESDGSVLSTCKEKSVRGPLPVDENSEFRGIYLHRIGAAALKRVPKTSLPKDVENGLNIP